MLYVAGRKLDEIPFDTVERDLFTPILCEAVLCCMLLIPTFNSLENRPQFVSILFQISVKDH